MDAQPPHDDLDPATAEALEQGYATRVGLDTAARHLWVLHRFAGMGEPAEGTAQGAVRSETWSGTPRSDASGGHAGDDEPQAAEGAQPAPAPEPAPEGRRRTRQLAVSLLTGAVLLVTSGGAVAASGSALPGDTLYPVKRGTEQVRLVLATRWGTDAQLHLAMARKRWAEAKRAAPDRPDVVAGLVHDAIDALEVAERGHGDVAHQAGSLRSELMDERATIAGEVATAQRGDVESSLERLAASDGTDVAGPSDGQTDATATEPGDSPDGSSTIAPSPGDPHEFPAPSEEREQAASPGEPSEEERGEADGAEADDDSRAEGGNAGDEESADEDGVSAVEEGGDTAGEGLAASEDAAGEGLGAVPGAAGANQDAGPDESEAAPGAGADSDTAASDDAQGEAAPSPQGGEGGESPAGSSPTLSPDPTQQHIRYGDSG